MNAVSDGVFVKQCMFVFPFVLLLTEATDYIKCVRLDLPEYFILRLFCLGLDFLESLDECTPAAVVLLDDFRVQLAVQDG